MMACYHPDSKVEISGFEARHYDILLDLATLGRYSNVISRVIELMGLRPDDSVADFGAGTGRNACLMMKYISGDGEILGLDVSQDMISRFRKNCSHFPNVSIIEQRVDVPLDLGRYFTKVFISFVLHGFPHDSRIQTVRNAYSILEPGGEFFIFDYNEFSLSEMPLYIRIPFKMIECRYAFDFIKRDWKKILSDEGFTGFEEHLFFRGFVRLLKAVKPVD